MLGLVRRTAVRVLLSALVAAAGTLPYASAAVAQDQGANGDIKVHDAATPETDQRDDPQVCQFYLVGFNFDANQQVAWTISEQPPTGTAQVEQGVLTLDEEGFGRTADMTLPNGHYKVEWVAAGSPGAPKSKVFWVRCATESPSPTPDKTTTPAVPTKFPAGYANASDARPFPPLGAVIGVTGMALFIAGLLTLIGTARRRGRHEI